MPAHLTPLSTPTPQALITGDPRRAFGLAQALMVQPAMSHQARGLWGYTGETEGGLALTVQSTGAGSAGAISVIGDLAGLGVKQLVRIGTCVAPGANHEPGTVLLVDRAIPADGASRTLAPGNASVVPDPALLELLDPVAPRATVSSHDFVARYDPAGDRPAPGASARDLQSAAVLAFAGRLGIETVVLLVVNGDGTRPGPTEAELEDCFFETGRQVTRLLEKAGP